MNRILKLKERNLNIIMPDKMFHLARNRVADQVHGTSQIDATKWIIDARNEALADERVIKHRDKALGIAYYDTTNSTKITSAKSEIHKAVENGDMLLLPKDELKIEPYPSRSSEDRQNWLQYLENLNYQTGGVPRSIATSDGTSEVGGRWDTLYLNQSIQRNRSTSKETFGTKH